MDFLKTKLRVKMERFLFSLRGPVRTAGTALYYSFNARGCSQRAYRQFLVLRRMFMKDLSRTIISIIPLTQPSI